jgi:hypothetical protein
MLRANFGSAMSDSGSFGGAFRLKMDVMEMEILSR